jgi:hypothetical protein
MAAAPGCRRHALLLPACGGGFVPFPSMLPGSKDLSMMKLITKLLRVRRKRTACKTASGAVTRVRPGVEPLEERQLLSTNPLPSVAVTVPQPYQTVPCDDPSHPGVALQSGNLVIQGTTSSDTVTVAQVYDKVLQCGELRVSTAHLTPPNWTLQNGILSPSPGTWVQDPDQFFNPTQVSKIYFFGDTGNDAFTNNTAIPCEAYGKGSDCFVGGSGNDILQGGTGPNFIEGGGGNDIFMAGKGDNTFTFAAQDLGSVTITGQANGHHNILDFSNFGPSGITLDLRTTAQQTVHRNLFHVADLQLTLATAGVIQEVQGSAFGDVIHADDYGDIIHGNGGNDTIYGGQGNDSLYGDAGDNTFICIGGGHHVVQGGTGHNTFWVNGTDTTDYSPARDDVEGVSHLHAVDSFMNYWYAEAFIGQHTVWSTKAPLSTVIPYAGNDNGGILPEPLFSGLHNQKGIFAYQDFSMNPLFASAGPTEDDVIQGGVGDCYLMSFLSGLAKTDPNRIRQYVTDLGDGSYAVDFHDANHHDAFVRVDGWLPTVAPGVLQYAQLGKDNALWVAIIEKAWTFYRCYVNPQVTAGMDITINDSGTPGELGTSFAIQETVHWYNSSEFVGQSVASYVNAIAAALNKHQGVVMYGPYDGDAGAPLDPNGNFAPWSDNTPLGPSSKYAHSFQHTYLVDQVGQHNGQLSVLIRDPYANSGNGQGYEWISYITAYNGSLGFTTYDPTQPTILNSSALVLANSGILGGAGAGQAADSVHDSGVLWPQGLAVSLVRPCAAFSDEHRGNYHDHINLMQLDSPGIRGANLLHDPHAHAGPSLDGAVFDVVWAFASCNPSRTD